MRDKSTEETFSEVLLRAYTQGSKAVPFSIGGENPLRSEARCYFCMTQACLFLIRGRYVCIRCKKVEGVV